MQRLPATTKPLVWVQHMPQNFTKSFANRLNRLAKIHVKEAENGDRIADSTCYIAPGGQQMRVKKTGSHYVLVVRGAEKVSGHCPSCDVLFESVAENFSNNAMGVILTGMGSDGTKGLVEMHRKGMHVIGQEEKSCVVYGMPCAAYSAGAVDEEMDIKDIAEGIIKVGGAEA